MSKEYKLSSVLYGHSLDVRALTVTPDNSIISGSRDKTAKCWRSNGFNAGYTDFITYKDQKNFVAAVLYLNPTPEHPEGLVVTGGNDKAILIYKPNEPFAFITITEHTNAVCCLSSGNEPNTFFSGSWDMTAKAWSLSNTNTASVTYSGHLAAVWGVIQVNNDRVVTACADRTIGLWSKLGEKIKTLTGHSDCVRGLADFPDCNYFASISNDASIKLWTYEGDLVDTLYGHSNFIYSIAKNASDGPNCFVTSDEDYSIRYWKDGQNLQVIRLPAQSIWSVACLNNGDIVAGSSDGMIRIFTQDESRYASADAQKIFEEEVTALQRQTNQEIGGYKVSDLPGPEALYDPGKSAGQIKMIRESGSVVAYTWVEQGGNSHWEKVGDVLGANEKANEGKTMYEGNPYDFVFSVDVEDGKPPLKLPYNKGEDVYMAANKFLTRNNLPAAYMDQVVDFIFKNSQVPQPVVDNNYVDPFTGGSRYQPGSASGSNCSQGVNLDPLTGGSSYSTNQTRTATSSMSVSSGSNVDPFTSGNSYATKDGTDGSYFPHIIYIRFDMGDPRVILNKLKEFNQKIGDDASKVNEAMINDVVKLCTDSCTDSKVVELLFQILQWPDDKIFPAIDVVRLAVRNEVNNNLITLRESGSIIDKLRSYIGNECAFTNNTVVSFRAICNLFLHPSGEELVFMNRVELLETIASFTTTNKNAEIGLATFLLNLTILVLKRADEVGVILLSTVLPEIIPSLRDSEAQFRAFVGLGTLMTAAEIGLRREVKVKVAENASFARHLETAVNMGTTELELKRRKCAGQVQKELVL